MVPSWWLPSVSLWRVGRLGKILPLSLHSYFSVLSCLSCLSSSPEPPPPSGIVPLIPACCGYSFIIIIILYNGSSDASLYCSLCFFSLLLAPITSFLNSILPLPHSSLLTSKIICISLLHSSSSSPNPPFLILTYFRLISIFSSALDYSQLTNFNFFQFLLLSMSTVLGWIDFQLFSLRGSAKKLCMH